MAPVEMRDRLSFVARLARLPKLSDIEERYTRKVFALCAGDVTLTAKVLGVGRATLYRRLKLYQLQNDTRGRRTQRELELMHEKAREAFDARPLQALREAFARVVGEGS